MYKCSKKKFGHERRKWIVAPCQRWIFHATVLLFALASHARDELSPKYDSIVPGLDYAHVQMTNWNNGEPWSIHIARLDRTKRNLHLASTLAQGHIFGTATVSEIAESFPKETGNPLALINAGFCIRTAHPYRGAPRGMVITDGELISSPALSTMNYSFWLEKNGGMHFGKFEPDFSATLPNGATLPIGINTQCKPDGVMLFTHVLGASTRATNNLELILEKPNKKQLSWSVGESYSLRIIAVNASGNTALSNGIAVLSFGSETASTFKATELRVGDAIKVKLKTSPELKNVVTACHATFPIVENGQPLEKFDASGAIVRRNPRTIIGFNKRYFFMVVVDGRQKTLSMGMNTHEMAEFMKLLGCTEAANLDGGGSSTFWLDGVRRNSVPGGRERDRADALVIVQRSDKRSAATVRK